MSEPKSKPQPAKTSQANSANVVKVEPPKKVSGPDQRNRAYDPSIKTKDLTREEKRARRQLRKGQEKDLELKRLEAEAAGKVVEVAPIAQRAKMRMRHWGLLSSFFVFVLAPLVITFWYLQERAVDQFASTVAFTVQQEQGGAPSDFLTGFAAQVGGGGADTDILYEFIQSQQMVVAIDNEFDLVSMYSLHFEQDPVFSLAPDATLEDLVEYWSRIIRVSYDSASQLIEIRVLAYDPVTAQSIARSILEHSQTLINELNTQARTDKIQYAQIDLSAAEDRLSSVRSELIVFRTRTQIVDPETDLAGRLGVVNTLQQQLASALVEYDLLAQSTGNTDPRVVQASRTIDVIRDRLAEERANVAQGQDGVSGKDYPTLLAEYEGLVVSREISEQMYRAALTSLEVARAEAARQSRYLSAYIQPTLPETAEYPRRTTLFGLAAIFILLSWTIAVLIYYSARDSR